MQQPKPGLAAGVRDERIARLLLRRGHRLTLLRWQHALLLLPAADRSCRHLLGAQVLEHHEVVRRVLLGQAGAGARGSRRRVGRGSRVNRGRDCSRGDSDTIAPRTVPADVPVRAREARVPVRAIGPVGRPVRAMRPVGREAGDASDVRFDAAVEASAEAGAGVRRRGRGDERCGADCGEGREREDGLADMVVSLGF